VCHFLPAIAPRNHRPGFKPRLHRRQLFKLGIDLPQLLVGIGREESVIAILIRAGIDAAVGNVAEPHQGFRVGDGQIPKQQRIYQGEDGGIGADAERQSQDNGQREPWCLSQLPQRIAKVLKQVFYEHDDHAFTSRLPHWFNST
jgi:hypothetical protein